MLYRSVSSFISFLLLQKPVNELGKSYVDFMRCSLDQIRQRIADELFTLSIFEVRENHFKILTLMFGNFNRFGQKNLFLSINF